MAAAAALAYLSLRPRFVGWTTVTYAQVFVGGRVVAVPFAAAAGVIAVGKSPSSCPSLRVTSVGGGGRMRKELRERERERVKRKRVKNKPKQL